MNGRALLMALVAGVTVLAVACDGNGRGRPAGTDGTAELATPTAVPSPQTAAGWVDTVQRVDWRHADPAMEEYAEYAGPAHCDWQRVRFLSVEHGRTRYIRDALGVLEGGYYRDLLIALRKVPVDAVDTGYRDGDRKLWMSGDEAFVYIVDGSYVEQWPRERQWYVCI